MALPMNPRIKDAKLERRRKEEELAKDLIEEARVQLMLKFRFLDLALWRMGLEPLRASMRYPVATDAKQVFFDPPRILARFMASFDEVVRDYLHMVMHCVFRHPFIKDFKNKEAWWLTCDVIAESVILDMCGGRFACEDDAACQQAIDEIKLMVGTMTPAKVYTFLRDVVTAPEGTAYRGIDQSRIAEWHDLFERDNHEAWPASMTEQEQQQRDEAVETDEDEPEQNDSMQLNPSSDDREQPEQEPEDMQLLPTDQEDDSSEDDGTDTAEDNGQDEADVDGSNADQGESENDSDSQEQKDWEEIAKQIEMNLETFSKEWGEEASSLVQNLHLANRKVYDYSTFLRRFMCINEQMKINDDEFDYIYYTFGMDMYGNTPLIEPLEYKDVKRIRDFVIAIDTSESVNGELVRRFIEHTFSILKESEDFSTKVNIHVVQCDSKIQSDHKITDLRDVDRLMDNFVIRGFGGTDFRPVFDYVETLRKRGDLTDLKGLLYFTDGLGDFPERPPDYDTAFVFMDSGERDLPPVPPWAMKVVVDELGINKLKSRVRHS
ncbi:MAG: VWA-like domain-containing protein [Coriobacteriia bacterium]|nr:VWA-like domain-containing protein [Coriobacteriia bacterium]